MPAPLGHRFNGLEFGLFARVFSISLHFQAFAAARDRVRTGEHTKEHTSAPVRTATPETKSHVTLITRPSPAKREQEHNFMSLVRTFGIVTIIN